MSKRRLFWLCLLLFAGHQLLQKGLGIQLPLLDAYLDPLLAMPIVLGLIDWERKRWFGAPPLLMWEIVAITIVFSMLFEWGFPHWNHRSVADGYDVVAYGLGSATYVLAQPVKPQMEG
jgi:hypothetical protein